MQETKININHNGEKLLFGKNVLELKDQSSSTFIAHQVDSLLSYCSNYDAVYFVKKSGIEVYAKNNVCIEVGKGLYQARPIATVGFSTHSALAHLHGINKKNMQLQSFTQFVKSMKNYLTVSSLPIIDLSNNVKLNKVVDIESKQDYKGNYAFSIRSESGKNDFELPGELAFEVPVFEGEKELKVKIVFDLQFNWSIEGPQSASLSFTLTNFDINTQIEEAVEEYFKKKLEGKTHYFGLYDIKSATNEWMYKESNLQL